jgi:hypothetical protein
MQITNMVSIFLFLNENSYLSLDHFISLVINEK